MERIPTLYVLLKRNGPAHNLMCGIRECPRADPYPRIVLLEPTADNCRWVNGQSSRDALGVVGDFPDPATENLLTDLKVPKINTSVRTRETTMIRVAIDNRAIGRLAAEYYLGLGFRHFAYVGHDGAHWSCLRGEGFSTAVLKTHGAAFTFLKDDALTAKALKRFPRPLAVLACDDRIGIQVIELARKARLKVPTEIAVLGVNNDEVLCQLAAVPLSSVDDNGRQTGVEAMNILSAIRAGQRPPEGETLIPPNGVITRASTEITAVGDAEISTALEIIRRDACKGLTVEKLLENLGVSRGTIERRFREVMGHTPFQEIRRIRFETARRLLADTRLKVSAIGRRCGYRDAKRFTKEFHAEVGATPTAWRKTHGG